MNMRDEILQQAMNLSPDDRAFVVDQLELSLVGQFHLPTEEVQLDPKKHIFGEEFLKELQKRSQAYKDGLTTSFSAEEVITDLYKQQSQFQK